MRVLCGVALMVSVALAAAHGQSACRMVREEHFTCDRDGFVKRLAEAKVIRVDAGRMELFATDRTDKLVAKLGKQVAGPEDHADLTFEVAAVDRSGHMDLGPQDVPLARLNVYDTAHRLVWVETLDGQQEVPWEADVMELLKRFQADIAGSRD